MASVLSMPPLKHASTGSRKHAFRARTTLTFMPTYGQRLSTAMELARVTDRAKLADALEISVQAVGMVLAGKTRALTAENSAKAARFLKVDHYWLATGEGEARPSSKVSDEAMEFARRYDHLNEAERRRFSALLLAARDGVPDAKVESGMPITAKRPRQATRHE